MTPDLQGCRMGILERFEFAASARQAMRPNGRPKTRTPAYLAGLLRDHAAMAEWFQLAHGRAARSDVELLNAFLQSEFQKLGLRAGRVQSPEVQARIKTLRNHLSEARKVFSRIPETPLLPGCSSKHTDVHWCLLTD